MTLTFPRASLKPTDISAYLGACLGLPADSVSSLAVAVGNRYAVRSLERKLIVLTVVSELVQQLQRQEITMEVAAYQIDKTFKDGDLDSVDPTWASGTFHLGFNR